MDLNKDLISQKISNQKPIISVTPTNSDVQFRFSEIDTQNIELTTLFQPFGNQLVGSFDILLFLPKLIRSKKLNIEDVNKGFLLKHELVIPSNALKEKSIKISTLVKLKKKGVFKNYALNLLGSKTKKQDNSLNVDDCKIGDMSGTLKHINFSEVPKGIRGVLKAHSTLEKEHTKNADIVYFERNIDINGYKINSIMENERALFESFRVNIRKLINEESRDSHFYIWIKWRTKASLTKLNCHRIVINKLGIQRVETVIG